MRASLARAVVSVPLLVGCGTQAAGTSVEPGTSASPIAGGTLDMAHPAVFEEFTHWSNTVSSCTASLIAPNVLLTARHCISQGNTEHVTCGETNFSAPVAGSATIVTPDATPGQSSTFYRGADVRVPSEGNDICGYDVALLILAEPIFADQVTPLIPRIDRPVVTGEAYVAVGYGVDDKGQENPGRMMLGNLDVRCLSDECEMPFGVAPSEFMGTAGICSGDSGGPALDDDGKIIGVVSRGTNPCATPIYSQVAPWSDFITQTVLEQAAAVGYRPPFWAFSGSSDLPPGLLDEGEHCTDSSECYPGTVCYYEADPAAAACTAVCANNAQCASGDVCRPGFDVQGGGLCLAPAPSTLPDPPVAPTATAKLHGADESCAFSPRSQGAQGPAAAGSALALLLGLALFRLRRVASGRGRSDGEAGGQAHGEGPGRRGQQGRPGGQRHLGSHGERNLVAHGVVAGRAHVLRAGRPQRHADSTCHVELDPRAGG